MALLTFFGHKREVAEATEVQRSAKAINFDVRLGSECSEDANWDKSAL